MMMAFMPLEFVVTPDTTYILIGMHDHIAASSPTDATGRKEIEPTYPGYSIGRWIDEDGDGRYDVLEVETRGFKGPRAYDEAGLPLHFDNQSIFKERIYLDKADPNILHDEITVIDHALTRPWTVDKKYVRNPDPRPIGRNITSPKTTRQVVIGKENYFLSGDGLLMPAKKDQPPPDLRYFKASRK